MEKSVKENLVSKISRHEILVMSAALAYTTALTLAPFMLILLSLVSFLDPELQKQLVSEMVSLFGSSAGAAVKAIVENVDEHPTLSGVSGLIGFLVLLISASAIFTQLRIALDKINEYVAPAGKSGFKYFMRGRFRAVGLVLGFAFLSIVSLMVTAMIAIVSPMADAPLWHFLSLVISFLLFAVLFTAIYRFIPSKKTSWARCFLSGSVSTVFYLIGKTLIGLYLGKASLGSAYGAAGSLIVFLAWVYYTALTLLVSYEFSLNVLLSRVFGRRAVLAGNLP